MAKRSFLDRALGAVGLQRKRTTGASARSYAGAQFSRLTEDWWAATLSADLEIKGSLRRLRARSRSLVRDFSYASRFVQSVAENVAGPDGIGLQVRVATQGGPNAGALKSSLNDEVEAKWREWCEAENCTVDGQESFEDLQHLLCETIPQDGEGLVRVVQGFPGNRFRFALQVLDPDQLDDSYEGRGAETGNIIRQGVELDAWGRPVAYWLWTQHPSDYGYRTRTRERVPADQIIHLRIRRRANQTRGVPWFAPVLLDERMLAGWQEASITAARMGALAQFFLKADPDKVSPEEAPLQSSVELDLDVGTVGQVLPPGYDVTTFDPKYPNAEFGSFRTAILQSAAIGLRVSALTLTGDTSQANYSSMRAGLLPERDAWRLIARWFVRHFHRRVYRAWVRASVLSGALVVPPRELERVLQADTWQFRGWPHVQPLEDIQAEEREIRLGVKSRTMVAGERGRNWEDVVAQLAEEQEVAAAYDVDVSGTDGPAATQGSADQQDTGETPNGGTGDGTGAGEDETDGAAAADAGGGDRARRLRLARGRG